MANRKKVTGKKRARFLEALRTGSSVTQACRIADFSRQAAYENRDLDPEFRKAWDVALEEGTDRLEDVALRRATLGVERGVFWRDRQIGTVHEVSDTLLIFLLKARRPEKYRERFDVSNKDGSLRGFVEAMNRVEREANGEPEQPRQH